jgi:hypothetical protein
MGGSERWLVLAVAVGAGVGGWYIGRGAERPALPSPADGTPELVDVLERIERLLADRAGESREPEKGGGLIVPPRAPRRSEVAGEEPDRELVRLGSEAALERLTRAIVALEASLGRQTVELERVRQGGSRRSELVASLAGTNLRQLDLALGDLQRDPDAVRGRLMLLTRDDVLSRFGIPNEVQGSWWSYEWGDLVDGQSERGISFSFDGDNVKWVEFKPQP